ncbi:MAG TPA: hypothetical protein DCX79_05575 [Planctomycetaceae bacterium]|nr:hypothetical protein [Planctomycetaceae bacterium]
MLSTPENSKSPWDFLLLRQGAAMRNLKRRSAGPIPGSSELTDTAQISMQFAYQYDKTTQIVVFCGSKFWLSCECQHKPDIKLPDNGQKPSIRSNPVTG